MVDGYAPFCKHLFIPNFTNWTGCVQITPENEPQLKTAYESRRENELPVLVRWFDAKTLEPKPAAFLDVILYSKAQISLENKSTGQPDPHGEIDYEWAIICLKPQEVDYECPMNPITMMRNSMIEEGGSGVPVDKDLYMESVKFWSGHAELK